MELQSITSDKCLELVDPSQTQIIFTGFRPSAPRSNIDGGVDFTLGHLMHLRNIQTLIAGFKKRGIAYEVFCIIADVQGIADRPSSSHAKRVVAYKDKYSKSILSVLGYNDNNIHIFHESSVSMVLNSIAMHLMLFLDTGDLLEVNKIQERIQQVMNRDQSANAYRVIMRRFIQSVSLMSVGTTIVCGGEEEKSSVKSYNDFANKVNADLIKGQGVRFGRYGSLNQFIPNAFFVSDANLVGTDGVNMSTSKGNYISLTDPDDMIREKVEGSQPIFITSLCRAFGFQGGVDVVGQLIELLAPIRKNRGFLETEKGLAALNEKLLRSSGSFNKLAFANFQHLIGMDLNARS